MMRYGPTSTPTLTLEAFQLPFPAALAKSAAIALPQRKGSTAKSPKSSRSPSRLRVSHPISHHERHAEPHEDDARRQQYGSPPAALCLCRMAGSDEDIESIIGASAVTRATLAKISR